MQQIDLSTYNTFLYATWVIQVPYIQSKFFLLLEIFFLEV